eukprot:451045-Prorocentrum_minimum.AAC.2
MEKTIKQASSEAGPPGCPVARASCPVDDPYRGPLPWMLRPQIEASRTPRRNESAPPYCGPHLEDRKQRDATTASVRT